MITWKQTIKDVPGIIKKKLLITKVITYSKNYIQIFKPLFVDCNEN